MVWKRLRLSGVSARFIASTTSEGGITRAVKQASSSADSRFVIRALIARRTSILYLNSADQVCFACSNLVDPLVRHS